MRKEGKKAKFTRLVKTLHFSKPNTKCVYTGPYKQSKNGKATGLDGIGSKILKSSKLLYIYLLGKNLIVVWQPAVLKMLENE